MMLTAVSKAEEHSSSHFYEWAGKETDVKVQLHPSCKLRQKLI
jgi:hypothetical protein